MAVLEALLMRRVPHPEHQCSQQSKADTDRNRLLQRARGSPSSHTLPPHFVLARALWWDLGVLWSQQQKPEEEVIWIWKQISDAPSEVQGAAGVVFTHPPPELRRQGQHQVRLAICHPGSLSLCLLSLSLIHTHTPSHLPHLRKPQLLVCLFHKPWKEVCWPPISGPRISLWTLAATHRPEQKWGTSSNDWHSCRGSPQQLWRLMELDFAW